MLTVLKIIATLGLVALNGFFVAVEFAAVSARVGQLKPRAKGSLRVRAALSVKNNLGLFLSSCQLGNTLASLALGAVTEPIVGTLVEPVAIWFGFGHKAMLLISFLLSFSIAVALHIVIGEQAPKNLSIRYADRILVALAAPLIVFTYLFYPALVVECVGQWRAANRRCAGSSPCRHRAGAFAGGIAGAAHAGRCRGDDQQSEPNRSHRRV